MDWALLGAGALWLASRAGGSSGGGSVRVYNRDLAAGVHPSLIGLLDAWDAEGWFPVRVAPNGGLRTDAAWQANTAASGGSYATTLASTPHGRGAGLDIWPEGFNPNGPSLSAQPDSMQKMLDFGEWAESKGFTWGGRWNKLFTPAQKAGIDPPGDWPHVEIKGWSNLPYPGPNGGPGYPTTGGSLSGFAAMPSRGPRRRG